MRLVAVAAVCFALFVALGWWVTHHPLACVDVFGASLRGRAEPLAIAFTNSGYGIGLTVIGVATIVGAIVSHLPVRIPLLILASQLASQLIVNIAKGFFDRPRPLAWVYRHEVGLAYPSGHATTAVVFYGAWLLVMWNCSLPLPARVAGVALLAMWSLGICWSRVALGAHYASDVTGGVLFGVGWLCLAIALVQHVPGGATVET